MRHLLHFALPALGAAILGFAGAIATAPPTPVTGDDLEATAPERPDSAPAQTRPTPPMGPETPEPSPVAPAAERPEVRVAATEPQGALPAERPRGRVVDLLGRPIEGATVIAAAEPADVLAQSGADGTFTASRSLDAPTQLVASLPGRSFAAALWKPGTPVTLVGRDAAPIELDVRLPDGRAPESARIELQRLCAPFVSGGRDAAALEDARFDPESGVIFGARETLVDALRTWTPEAPALATDGRPLSATVSVEVEGAAGKPALRFRSDLIRVDPGRDGPGPHRVALRPSSRVSVLLTDATGQTIESNGWVSLSKPRTEGGLDQDIESAKATPLEGEDGTFTTADLAPGSYVLFAGLIGEPALVRREVSVPHGDIDLEVALPPVAEGEFLSVQVVLPGGASPEGAVLESSAAGNLFEGGPPFDEKGRVSIPWFRLLGEGQPILDPRGLMLTCSLPEFGETSTFIRYPDKNARLTFRPPASVVVAGLEEDSRTFTLTARALDDSGRFPYDYVPASLVADLAGGDRPRVGPLQPGLYALTLRAKSGEDDGFYGSSNSATDPFLARQTATLGPGDNFVRFAFVEGEQLVVRYDQEGGRGPYFLVTPTTSFPGDPEYFRNGKNGRRGRAVFDDLRPGRYQVWCYSDGIPAAAEVQVPGPPLDFDLETAGPVRVTSLLPDGYAETLGLREGDRLVAAGGIGDDDPAAMIYAIRENLRRSSTIAVERGGQRLEFTVGPFPNEYDPRRALGADFLRLLGDSVNR